MPPADLDAANAANVALSRDGALVAATSRDGLEHVWDAAKALIVLGGLVFSALTVFR